MAKNKKKKKKSAASKPANVNNAKKNAPKGDAVKKAKPEKKAASKSVRVDKSEKKPDRQTPKAKPSIKKAEPKTSKRTFVKGKFSERFAHFSIQKNSKKTVALILCAGVLIFAICFAVSSGYNEFMIRKLGVDYAAVEQQQSMYDIDIDAAEVKERVKNTNRHGQKSAFTYFCEEQILFPSYSPYGSLIFANPASNDCDLVVTILGRDGRFLYRSDGIAPGKYLSQIRLMDELEAGEHACRLYVMGFDRETNKPVGIQYTNLKIVIEGK